MENQNQELWKYKRAQCAYDAYRCARVNRMDTFCDLSHEEKDVWLSVYNACVNRWKIKRGVPAWSDGDSDGGSDCDSDSD